MKRPDFRAVIIEASAGTGKTSRITREFTGILDRDDPAAMMHRILAMTFSEKAAIEMKVRILETIYAGIYPGLSEKGKIEAENAMLKLRISTIHSFCQSTLKRFAFYTGMDPFFTVIDERQSDLLYYRAFYNFLNGPDSKSLLPVLKSFKLNALKSLISAVRKCHPYATAGVPEGGFSKTIYELSSRISQIHARMKKELSVLDFNDLEIFTYRMLSEHPESLTILEDFDEKNNYIFVDEFQDTNVLQWKIVFKLVEEWLSGYGAKAERGESYGLFLVGDKKQSIYKFRGAEGGVFDDAGEVLRNYRSEEKLLKNYRSEPEILEFVNRVFSGTPLWTGQELSSGLEKKHPCRVEINLVDFGGDAQAKEKEYDWVLGRILRIVKSKEPVWDRNTGVLRPAEFRDIALLMRKKAGNNFPVLEKKLEESGIPFVVLGGIGFYHEPEVIFLLSLVFALADPADKLSLWNLCSSVYKIPAQKVYEWRRRLSFEELTMAVESILEEINFWDGLGTQQKANTEKFLILLEEWQDMPLYRVSANLRTVALSSEESKADIFSEHQNAVRILTVHNAKGMEFPAVFLLNAEDGRVVLRDEILYRKTSQQEVPYRFVLKREAEEESRQLFKRSLEEEEERVLYVALTRARQYLFVSGVKNKRGSDSGLWLNMLRKYETAFPPLPASAVSSAKEEKTVAPQKKADKEIFAAEREYAALTSYTREKEREYYRYERTVAGDIAHKLLCDLSEGRIIPGKEAYEKRVRFYLGKSGLQEIREIENVLMGVYENIEKNPQLAEVVKERPEGSAFSELPFIIEAEKDRVYAGAVDRIILEGKDACRIYDYKLEGGHPQRHKQQMSLYEKAARKIFPGRPVVKKFVVFLKSGTLHEI